MFSCSPLSLALSLSLCSSFLKIYYTITLFFASCSPSRFVSYLILPLILSLHPLLSLSLHLSILCFPSHSVSPSLLSPSLTVSLPLLYSAFHSPSHAVSLPFTFFLLSPLHIALLLLHPPHSPLLLLLSFSLSSSPFSFSCSPSLALLLTHCSPSLALLLTHCSPSLALLLTHCSPSLALLLLLSFSCSPSLALLLLTHCSPLALLLLLLSSSSCSPPHTLLSLFFSLELFFFFSCHCSSHSDFLFKLLGTLFYYFFSFPIFLSWFLLFSFLSLAFSFLSLAFSFLSLAFSFLSLDFLFSFLAILSLSLSLLLSFQSLSAFTILNFIYLFLTFSDLSVGLPLFPPFSSLALPLSLFPPFSSLAFPLSLFPPFSSLAFPLSLFPPFSSLLSLSLSLSSVFVLALPLSLFPPFSSLLSLSLSLSSILVLALPLSLSFLHSRLFSLPLSLSLPPFLSLALPLSLFSSVLVLALPLSLSFLHSRPPFLLSPLSLSFLRSHPCSPSLSLSSVLVLSLSLSLSFLRSRRLLSLSLSLSSVLVLFLHSLPSLSLSSVLVACSPSLSLSSVLVACSPSLSLSSVFVACSPSLSLSSVFVACSPSLSLSSVFVLALLSLSPFPPFSLSIFVSPLSLSSVLAARSPPVSFLRSCRTLSLCLSFQYFLLSHEPVLSFCSLFLHLHFEVFPEKPILIFISSFHYFYPSFFFVFYSFTLLPSFSSLPTLFVFFSFASFYFFFSFASFFFFFSFASFFFFFSFFSFFFLFFHFFFFLLVFPFLLFSSCFSFSSFFFLFFLFFFFLLPLFFYPIFICLSSFPIFCIFLPFPFYSLPPLLTLIFKVAISSFNTKLRTDDRRIHHRPGPLDLPVERTLPDPLGDRRYPSHLAELEHLRLSTIQQSDVTRASTDANGFRHPSVVDRLLGSVSAARGNSAVLLIDRKNAKRNSLQLSSLEDRMERSQHLSPAGDLLKESLSKHLESNRHTWTSYDGVPFTKETILSTPTAHVTPFAQSNSGSLPLTSHQLATVDQNVSHNRLKPLPADIPPVTQHSVTSTERCSLPVIPETQRLDYTSLDSRYPVDQRLPLDSRLPVMLPSYQGIPDVRIPNPRLADPRYSVASHLFPSTHSMAYPSSNSNLAILEESRAISTLALPSTHSNYPIISHREIFNTINPTNTISASPYISGSPSAVLPTTFLYPHLYSSSPQYQSSFYMPTSDVRNYEILGQRSDIPGRSDRPSLTASPGHLQIDVGTLQNKINKDDENNVEMRLASTEQTTDVHMRDDLRTNVTDHVSTTSARSSHTTDSADTGGSVWRPY
ncbi:unnamed protein product [Acanthosepion pharaonis]|uniref:Uncharacterized protein n=1 Tax=Acanthosepion pharaonis TaxID=158019 RepID=A0A812D8X6_ACAPH|nr:unnamed protein product [Sepia pharaonis]